MWCADSRVDSPPPPPPGEGEGKPAPASAPATEEWILVGRVSRAIGLKGWIRVLLMSDNPHRFQPEARLYWRRRGHDCQEVHLAEVKSHHSGTMVEIRLRGCEDCDAAQAFVSGELVIPWAERSAPPRGAYYPDELVGMAVFDPDGSQVGEVAGLEIEVPSPYLVVKPAAGTEEVCIPFRKVFIAAIDRGKKLVRLAEPLANHIPAS